MVEAVHVVWVTAGLSCDGDTIAMTAASLPSIEELVAGALPGALACVLPGGRLLRRSEHCRARSGQGGHQAYGQEFSRTTH